MRTKKPKIGRPPGATTTGRSGKRDTVQVRVSKSEAKAFDDRAHALDLTVSEWLRILARRDCGMWPHGDTTGPLRPS